MHDAIAALWRLRPPGPDNILAHPAFVRLREICRDSYPNAGRDGPNFALSTGLRAFSLPCGLSGELGNLALPVDEAATRLAAALGATQAHNPNRSLYGMLRARVEQQLIRHATAADLAIDGKDRIDIPPALCSRTETSRNFRIIGNQ